jgi:hypothetical protein
MQFYYISIFTSVIVMDNRQPGYSRRGLQLVVFGVVIVHILSLSVMIDWNNPRSLFGKGGYKLNRYSSTHTMHIHKINHVNVPGKLYSPSDPIHWDALGLIIPALDESAQIHRYKIGRTQMHSDAYVCNEWTLPACLLENNAGDYLLLNGDSLSIISEISPSVYLATLLIVYLLSSIPYVECVVSSTFGIRDYNAKILRKGLMIVILIVYFCGLLFAYAGSPFNKMQSLKSGDVYYSISSHMASILVCLLTVFIYLLHLRGSNSSVFINGPYVLVTQDAEDPKNTVGTQLSDLNSQPPIEDIGGLVKNPELRKAASLSISDSGMLRENIGPPRSQSMRALFSYMPQFQIFSDSERGLQGSRGLRSREADGPFSSETSVLISITLFLGGVGNIGMSHGVVLEIETQLVLACTLGFAVLEVCSYRLEAYYFYIFDVLIEQTAERNAEPKTEQDLKDEKETYFFGIYFIRSVVLVLQLWLLGLYNSTVTEMGYNHSVPERVVFVLTTLYFSIQVLIHLCQITLIGRNVFRSFGSGLSLTNSPAEKINETVHLAHYWLELVLCVISFFVIFGALFGYVMSNGLHPEGTLEAYEKMQYGLTMEVDSNPYCKETGKYRNVKLVGKELSDQEIRGDLDAKWTSDVDPIDLKVFFWTKYWNLDMSRIAMHSMPRWFCRNGFEHHWMQCLSNDKPLPPTVEKYESEIEKFK